MACPRNNRERPSSRQSGAKSCSLSRSPNRTRCHRCPCCPRSARPCSNQDKNQSPISPVHSPPESDFGRGQAVAMPRVGRAPQARRDSKPSQNSSIRFYQVLRIAFSPPIRCLRNDISSIEEMLATKAETAQADFPGRNCPNGQFGRRTFLNRRLPAHVTSLGITQGSLAPLIKVLALNESQRAQYCRDTAIWPKFQTRACRGRLLRRIERGRRAMTADVQHLPAARAEIGGSFEKKLSYFLFCAVPINGFGTTGRTEARSPCR